MKYRSALLLVAAVILLDQVVKIYVKTHFFYGEEVNLIGTWARLHFLENEGMAFGLKLSATPVGKIILSLFRLGAVIFGFYILKRLVDRRFNTGLIVCGSLILAGALGNLIDSLFYGMIFTESSFHVAKMVPWGQGYGRFLHGRVVDMLYFPLVDVRVPSGWPLVGGKRLAFFEPVFNIADAAITVGVLALVLFQKRLLQRPAPVQVRETDATAVPVS